MTLESCFIGIDTSRAMRNEDIDNKSRLYYQHALIEKLAQSKFQQNVESKLSLFDMSNSQFLIHNAKNLAPILKSIHIINRNGAAGAPEMPNISHTISTALIALKHRPESHAKARIILIISSSYLQNFANNNNNNEDDHTNNDDIKAMMNLGATLKRQKIAIDIITIGIELPKNVEDSFKEFIEKCSGDDNLCSFYVLDEKQKFNDFSQLKAMLHYSNNSGNLSHINGSNNRNDSMDLDVDDPQLALALKLSLEDQENEIMKRKKNLEDSNKDATDSKIEEETERNDSVVEMKDKDNNDDDNINNNNNNNSSENNKE